MEHDWMHLNIDLRTVIEKCLDRGAALKLIADDIGKDPRTISKEIKLHRVFNSYENRRRYNNVDISKKKPCKTLNRFPFVCNACERKRQCILDHYYYSASSAQKAYESLLSSSRQGIGLSKTQYEDLDKMIHNGTQKGQSIYAIMKSNPDKNYLSTRSIYYLIDSGKLTTKPIDLRRKVVLKIRKKYEYKKTTKEKNAINGRTIDCYYKFILENPGLCTVQLDTVEGKKTCKKVLMTLHWVNYHFMYVAVLEEQNSKCVVETFKSIYKKIGTESFKKLFPCILTDRGQEFVNPVSIEVDEATGELVTNVFFCDAYISNQKGAIESNHRLLRYIVPKGSNTDYLNKEHGLIITNEIGNYPRRELGGKTPIQIMKIFFNKELDLLGIVEKDSNKLNLTPTLLINK